MVGKARRRGVGARRAARPPQEAEEEEEEQQGGQPPSPGDPRYFQDQVDAFHEARAQAALAPAWSDVESGAEEAEAEEEEEVLGLDVSEEDEEIDGEDEEIDREDEEIDGEDDDIDEEDDDIDGVQDVDDGDEDEDEDQEADPSLAWGRRKNLYYSSDYGARRGPARSEQEVDEEEREEEEEARLIQQRLAQALQEDDVGLSWLPELGPGPRAAEPAQRGAEHVQADPASLPAADKLRLLRREAPELPELAADLRARLTEARDQLEPLLRLAERGGLARGRGGARYVRTKYSLSLLYCAHVCFYLALKARRVPVRGHPLIARLVAYRRLLSRLAALDRRLAPQVCRLLPATASPSQKRAAAPDLTAALGPADDSDSDLDPEAALKHYRGLEERLTLKRKKGAEEEQEQEEEGELDPQAKRAITYQIAKNKGLTPRRKKIDRNPRVKHREKFRRATIRRKGQVRPVRTEERKYAGEASGIRAGVKKSIKLR